MGSLIDQAWDVVSESRNLDGEVDIISDLIKEVEALEGKLERINQWCRAYPRTVFIEPTKEQWKEANKVLEAHKPDTPGLSAISGSNMRHVVEGIAKIAATEQGTDDE
jgi:hypothetical protein